ncbi:hypothetical protein L209DRAFT_487700 [Thermothelomyces heterothallicus CBS 203.75]
MPLVYMCLHARGVRRACCGKLGWVHSHAPRSEGNRHPARGRGASLKSSGQTCPVQCARQLLGSSNAYRASWRVVLYNEPNRSTDSYCFSDLERAGRRRHPRIASRSCVTPAALPLSITVVGSQSFTPCPGTDQGSLGKTSCASTTSFSCLRLPVRPPVDTQTGGQTYPSYVVISFCPLVAFAGLEKWDPTPL